MGLTPQDFPDAIQRSRHYIKGSEDHLANEGAAIRVHLNKHDAAEAVIGAHHIATMDEIGIADHAVTMEAQIVEDADAVDSGAMFEVLMAFKSTVTPAIMPGIGRGGADTGSRKDRQRRCCQKLFHARHDHLLNSHSNGPLAVHDTHLTQAKLNRVWTLCSFGVHVPGRTKTPCAPMFFL
jgi:hypothetical protein